MKNIAPAQAKRLANAAKRASKDKSRLGSATRVFAAGLASGRVTLDDLAAELPKFTDDEAAEAGRIAAELDRRIAAAGERRGGSDGAA